MSDAKRAGNDHFSYADAGRFSLTIQDLVITVCTFFEWACEQGQWR